MIREKYIALRASPEVIDQVRKYVRAIDNEQIEDVTAEFMVARKSVKAREWDQRIRAVTAEYVQREVQAQQRDQK